MQEPPEIQVRFLGWEDAPWRRKWQPILVFSPGNIPWTEEELGGLYTVHGVAKEPYRTEHITKEG